MAWQENVEFPEEQIDSQKLYDGFREVDSGTVEKWVGLEKNIHGEFHIIEYNYEQNSIILCAIGVSFVLSLVVGFVIMIGVTYSINYNYINVVKYIKSITIYTSLEENQTTKVDEKNDK
jgi:hypothetical protein